MSKLYKNLFEGADFGDRYLTRDGRRALFLRFTTKKIDDEMVDVVNLVVEDKEDNDFVTILVNRLDGWQINDYHYSDIVKKVEK